MGPFEYLPLFAAVVLGLGGTSVLLISSVAIVLLGAVAKPGWGGPRARRRRRR